MATKRWRLVLTELGASTPLSEVSVDADNWMAALRAARAKLGEDGAVPPGSSCTVAPDDKVTILDPASRRRYVLSPDAVTSLKEQDAPSGPRIPAEPAPKTDGPARKKLASRTVAYLPPTPPKPSAAVPVRDPAPQAAAPAAQPQAAQPQAPAAAPVAADQGPTGGSADPPPRKKLASRTVAYAVSPLAAGAPTPHGQRPPTEPAAQHPQAQPPAAQPPAAQPHAAQPPAAQPPSAPAPADEGVAPWELIASRDEEPTSETPLRYRERTYAVPEGTSIGVAEAVAQAHFEDIAGELAGGAPGKYVNIAVFDHTFDDKPRRPPLVTLQWKDWRGEPEVAYPLASYQVRRSSLPPPNVGQPVSTTDEHDRRLTQAFEACQDLLFLDTAAEGLEFVMRLLSDLVPTEAASGCLYDINDDELRFVVLSGAGQETRKGEGIPRDQGLFEAATRLAGTPVRIDDVSSDPRFDPGIDGRVGLDVRNALYIAVAHQGQLLGALQLLNRTGAQTFSSADADLLSYIGAQLGSFLHEARIKSTQRRA